MKNLLAFLLVISLTACLDLGLKTFRRAESEVGGVDGVVKVTGDNIMKAEEAARWGYAANGGDAEAQYNMGKAFCCGKRPYYNTYDALKWFCLAAKQGQRDAMYEIGKIYDDAHKEEGSVIPRDEVLAYVYYKKSVEHGNDSAIKSMNNKFLDLNKREREKATKILDEWPEIQCEVH